MKTKKLLTAALAVMSLCLCSCHKECVCTRYDGLQQTFSAEEVDANGGNCAKMRNYPVENHYSVCEWR